MSGRHFAPKGRFVGRTRPDLERMPHAFPPQRLAKLVVALEKVVGPADSQANVERSQVLQKFGVGQIGDEMIRRVKINVRVVVAAKQVRIPPVFARKVVSSAECYDLAK